ncbi:MAG: UDP-N-acetylmuramate:L-alanyl-gamma-D-glutamyl-meso-diaminopimelate ligase [Oceanospirillaceae bacterium]
MHIHILGICGTFMGSMAILARSLGHKVTGSDLNVYPPMSTQLQEQGIALMQGYKAEHLKPAPDLVVVGNALSRGNEAVEYVLDKGIPYISGAQWLKENVLQDRWVLAVAGTHGKTTTASMLTWILEYAKLSPGYLIGGVPNDFAVSARLGESPFFVIEADEYDTAFFDKRSKFVHYMPRTLVINNIEFDHADIFADLAAIQRQFHHLLRVVPSSGQVIYNSDQTSVAQVLAQGCWSDTVAAGTNTAHLHSAGDLTNKDDFTNNENLQTKDHWHFELIVADGSHFSVFLEGKKVGEIRWGFTGKHNAYNAIMALIAARHVGVDPEHAIAALQVFKGVKRRMELLGDVNGVKVYDDFAHHPTAIENTLDGLRKNVGQERIIAIIEPRSNTMRLGCHTQQLVNCVAQADQVIWYQPPALDWQLETIFSDCENSVVHTSIEAIIDTVIANTQSSPYSEVATHVVIMSNGGFDGIHQQLLARLVTSEQPLEDKNHECV